MAPLYILFGLIASCFVLSMVAKKFGFMKEEADILKEHRNKKIKD